VEKALKRFGLYSFCGVKGRGTKKQKGMKGIKESRFWTYRKKRLIGRGFKTI